MARIHMNQQMNKFITSLFILLLICAGMFSYAAASPLSQGVPTPPSVAGGIENSVHIQRSFAPNPPVLGDEVEVTIEVRGDLLPECYGIPTEPVDIMLIIDNSGSAFERDTLYIQKARALAQNLVSQISPTVFVGIGQEQSVRVGLITQDEVIDPGSGEEVLEPRIVSLDATTEELRAEIENLIRGSDTVIENSMPAALQELEENGRSGMRQIVVTILHDDGAFTDKGYEAFEDALANDVELYIIAVEQIDSEDAARATGGIVGHVLINPDSNNLRNAFLNMTEGQNQLAAGYIRVQDQVPISSLVFRSVDENGILDTAQGTVTWDILALQETDRLFLSYRATVIDSSSMLHTTTATWIDCNGYLQEWTESGAMPVVTPPNPTAAPTLRPTATPTVVPSTPGDSSIGETCECEEQGRVAISLFGRCFCAPWWLLLLPLLLLMLVALWKFRFTGRKRISKTRSPDTVPVSSSLPGPGRGPFPPNEPQVEQKEGSPLEMGVDIIAFPAELRQVLESATVWYGFFPEETGSGGKPGIRKGVYTGLYQSQRDLRPGLLDDLKLRTTVHLLIPLRSGESIELVPFHEFEQALDRAQLLRKGVFVAAWTTTTAAGDLEFTSTDDKFIVDFYRDDDKDRGYYFRIALVPRKSFTEVAIQEGEIVY